MAVERQSRLTDGVWRKSVVVERRSFNVEVNRCLRPENCSECLVLRVRGRSWRRKSQAHKENENELIIGR